MKVYKKTFRFGGEDEKIDNHLNIEDIVPETSQRKEEKINNSFFSFQSHLGPPEYRKWRRVHGLQLPLHPQQVAGWVIISGVGVATFLVLLPALRSFFRDLLFIVLGFLFAVHILSHLTALLLDPADPELRALKIKLCVPEFDRSKHAHVIENGRCHLCNIKTSSSKTKHCSICNKCIDHFDHHCKWLNHCIGGRNYVAFFICIISAVAASLVVVAVSVLEIVYYHVDPQLLTIFPNHQNNTTAEMFLPDSVFIGIITVLGLLAATSAGLLLHLCLFHCYISVLGISTYEYIKNFKQEGNAQNEVPFNCNHKKTELSNNIEGTHTVRSRYWIKFDKCFCYSCSQSLEKKETNFKCCLSKFSFFKSKNFLKGKKTSQRKKLKRQNTDPDFVDRTVKPFLISLNDDISTEVVKVNSKTSNFCGINKNKSLHCWKCNCVSENNKEKNNLEIKSIRDKKKKAKMFSCEVLRSWWPKIFEKQSNENANNNFKNKFNQICPTTQEQSSEGTEKIAPTKKVENYPQNVDPQYFTIMKTKVLPELSEILRKKNTVESDEIYLQIDKINSLESTLSLEFSLRSNCRKMRKKNIMKKPRSPVLSPIRESGLSNPGSPRIDLILPPSPVFVRPPTPETSIIFLSNPPSSSSDEDEIVTPPIPVINRNYTGDILETPQLPRKVFSTPKEERIFVLKSPKMKTSKWVDVEIRNGA